MTKGKWIIRLGDKEIPITKEMYDDIVIDRQYLRDLIARALVDAINEFVDREIERVENPPGPRPTGLLS